MKIPEQINRILLIMPPATISGEYTKEIQPPLGLAYIASCLENDYRVKIIDAVAEGWKTQTLKNGLITYGLSFDEIKNRICEFNPDVVGVSCLFSMQHKNAHRVCAIAKEFNPNIITIMGGAHPTALPNATLQDNNVDIVMLGEADFTTKETLDNLRQKKSLKNIDGIAFRNNGQIIINPKTKFIENLDLIPFPARHLLPMEKYFKINLPHGVSSKYSPNTPLITSRGCPANCIFCSIHSIWGYKYRARSVENIILELKVLKEKYHIKEIQFEDDNLTFDRNRAEKLFDAMVENKLNISWTTPNGVALWALDQKLLIKMKASGCYRLCLAIESGDQEFLTQTIKKPLDLKKVPELISEIKKIGFETDAFFVVGFPQETRSQLLNTFKFADKLGTDNVSFYLATPYPGTELYKICRDKGYFGKEFALDSLGVKKPSLITPNFSTTELEKMIAYYNLKHKISLLWRSPKTFYNKVIKRFFQTPGQFLLLTHKFMGKMFIKRK
jgi:magnesium-protoporphyrin IX monomethyl ester (oxidative) cyclase